MIDPAEIAELRELEAEATPRPWETRILDCFWRVTGPDGEQAFDDGSACDEYNKECSDETRDFIIAMRNALPALLDSARAVRNASVAVEQAIAVLDSVPPHSFVRDSYYDNATSALLDARRALTATAEPTAEEER